MSKRVRADITTIPETLLETLQETKLNDVQFGKWDDNFVARRLLGSAGRVDVNFGDIKR